ncbi:MAG: DUF1266 domain-containing protein [Oscillospiraceae bacterium]|jgi:hypothetical protein|nr:DUF1266 domain-containing protein [Oscillospiraceae bacterium]
MKARIIAILLVGLLLLGGCRRFSALTEPLETPVRGMPDFFVHAEAELSEPDDGEWGRWPPETAAERRRVYAFGAYRSFYYDLSDETLGGAGGLSKMVVENALRDEFFIEDSDTAKDVLGWIKEDGMTLSTDIYYGSNELLLIAQGKLLPPVYMTGREEEWLREIYEEYAGALAGYGYTEDELMLVETTVAGDLDMLVTVARMSYSAGYLTEEETWEYLSYAEELATASYGSWREYLAGILFSNAFMGMEGFYDYEVADHLLDNRLSPYELFEFGPNKGVAGRNYFGWHTEA